ncbi:MAG: N,N-dimethylformamidase beta subunit family domain-containing protein [Candidatus Krumholzibacteriia bacterium]
MRRHVFLGLLSCAFTTVVSVPNRASAAQLEGYATEISVVQGDTLELHIRCELATYRLRVLRQGERLRTVADLGEFVGQDFAVPASAWEGCAWPVTNRIAVPPTWESGAYLAQMDSGTRSSCVPFVVREEVPGSRGSILVQLSTNTWQAYNRYGGKNLYGAYAPGLEGRAHRVSFHRPHADCTGRDAGQFFFWAAPFLAFLESQCYAYEVCTGTDLHREPGLLDSYRVFVSVGHDEYYSKEMYDELERFLDTGGSLAFFSANSMWWQVRFEDDEHTMVCYKSRWLDPLTGTDDPRVTVNWHSWPVLRPPARLMGVYYNGSWGIPEGSYHVVDPDHWAFQGVPVDSGSAFGYPMVGFEVDSRTDDSPAGLDVIARTELPDHNNGGVLRPAEMIYYERTPEYGFPDGRGGKVFAGGTVDYARGLMPSYDGRSVGRADPVARMVTRNVLDRLGCALGNPEPAAPAHGSSVPGTTVMLHWRPARPHRSGMRVRYMVFWEEPDGRADSLDIAGTAVWVNVDGAGGSTYRWWVRGASECGAIATSPVQEFHIDPAAGALPDRGGPTLAVAPGPGRIRITVSVPNPDEGRITLYDVTGRRVRQFGPLALDVATSVDWDLRNAHGTEVAAGVYLVQVRAGPLDGTLTLQKKVIVLR